MEESVRSERGEIDVAVAVVVVVGDADSDSPSVARESGARGDVDELSAVVPVEDQNGIAAVPVVFHRRAVGDQKVGVAIVVVVEEAGAVAIDLDDVVLVRVPVDVQYGDAGVRGHIDERRPTGGCLAGCGRSLPGWRNGIWTNRIQQEREQRQADWRLRSGTHLGLNHRRIFER